MRDDCLKIILEALAMQLDRLKGEIFIRDYEIDRLKKENAELKSQRDALCRRDIENG